VSWTKKGFFIELPSPDLIASLDALAFCKKEKKRFNKKIKRKINSTKHLNKKNCKRGFILYGTVESTFCLFPIGLLAVKFSSTMRLLDCSLISELCRLSALLKAEFKISYKTTKNNVISKRFKPKKKMNTSHN